MTTTEDIETAAKALGIDLLPWQREYATAALNSENVVSPGGQKIGRHIVEAVIDEVHRRRARLVALGKARGRAVPGGSISSIGASGGPPLPHSVESRSDGKPSWVGRPRAAVVDGAQLEARNELAGIVMTVMDEHGLFAPLSVRYAIADAILAAGYSKAPNHTNGSEA